MKMKKKEKEIGIKGHKSPIVHFIVTFEVDAAEDKERIIRFRFFLLEENRKKVEKNVENFAHFYLLSFLRTRRR